MRHQVYIVDDDAQVRRSTCFLLKSHDISCRSFVDGEDFLDEMDRLPPGCVLLDMYMPGSSGLDVQAEMARHGSKLVVVAMSGHTDARVTRSALDLGAVKVLEKPFAEEALLAALQTCFDRLDDEAGPDSDEPGPAHH
jgi:two-component system response regulator FixJ